MISNIFFLIFINSFYLFIHSIYIIYKIYSYVQ